MKSALMLAACAALVAWSIPAAAQTNVVVNPGFESGASVWTQTSTSGVAIITNDGSKSRTGSWHAWMGGAVNIQDVLYQDVTVPSGGLLEFYYRGESKAFIDPGDLLHVEIVSPSTGTVLEELDAIWGGGTDGVYLRQRYDVSAFAGQRVRLRFRAVNDATDFSTFRIDDVSMVATSNAAAANYTALWWNSSESGWGMNVTQQGNIAFATLFTYDAGGAPLWLVMSQGNRQGSTETFAGVLYRTTGPAFNAVPFTPIGPGNLTQVGTMTLSFSGPSSGTLTYSFNGTTVTKPIQRQVYGARAASCSGTTGSRASATNYQDLWWNASESGWGVNLTHQGTTIFATLFTYGSNNQGLWLVMSAGTRQTDGSYLGQLYRMSGPPFNAQPFSGAVPTPVGTMQLRFQNGESGTLTYTVNGTTVTKSITRQVFSSPVSVCTS